MPIFDLTTLLVKLLSESLKLLWPQLYREGAIEKSVTGTIIRDRDLKITKNSFKQNVIKLGSLS